ncbi:hypothetical protein BGX24_000120, partial [Mortierella sp. AD032]
KLMFSIPAGTTPTGELTLAREYNYTELKVRLDLRAILDEKDKVVALCLIDHGDLLANQSADDHEEDVSSSDDDADDDIPEGENHTAVAVLEDPAITDRQRRIDTVIYVLNVMTVPHYQMKCMRSLVNVGRMNAVWRNEAKNIHCVKDLLKPRETIDSYRLLCISITAEVVVVESFTTPGTFYEIKIEFTRVSAGHIFSCGYPAFQKEETCCKNISLLQLEILFVNFLKVDRKDNHYDLDLLALAPEADDDDEWALQPSAHVPGLGVSYYLHRITSLDALRDKEKTLPQGWNSVYILNDSSPPSTTHFHEKRVEILVTNAKDRLIK